MHDAARNPMNELSEAEPMLYCAVVLWQVGSVNQVILLVLASQHPIQPPFNQVKQSVFITQRLQRLGVSFVFHECQ
jgi:hypothetical protein